MEALVLRKFANWSSLATAFANSWDERKMMLHFFEIESWEEHLQSLWLKENLRFEITQDTAVDNYPSVQKLFAFDAWNHANDRIFI